MLRFLHKQVNNHYFQIHLAVCFIVILFARIDNIQLGFFEQYLFAGFFAQMALVIIYLIRILYLNTKIMIFISYSHATKKNLDDILKPSFNARQWCDWIGPHFSIYEKILILKIFTHRNLFIKRGNQYFYNESDSLDENH